MKENPENINLFCLNFLQVKDVRQFAYVDESEGLLRRNGHPYYRLLIDQTAIHGPSGILAPCIWRNGDSKELMEERIAKGEVYMSKTDWEITHLHLKVIEEYLEKNRN